MWRVTVMLTLGSFYSSAEQYNLTVTDLPEYYELEEPPGTPAFIEDYPYVAQVRYDMELVCAGALLTARHVLSAAHCFFDARGRRLVVSRLSCAVETDRLTGGSMRRVSKIINHAWYDAATRDHDISVLLVESEFYLRPGARPAAVPAQGGRLPDNATLTVVGWGLNRARVGQPSTTLRVVSLYNVNINACAWSYRGLELVSNQKFPVTDNMLCIGALDERELCASDGGGPVVWGGAVVGVGSWGEGCARAALPAVSTRVSAYTNWIAVTIKQNRGPASPSQTVAALLILSILVSIVF